MTLMTDADALQAVQNYLADEADGTVIPQAAIRRVFTLAMASVALSKTLAEREREIDELRKLIDPSLFRDLDRLSGA